MLAGYGVGSGSSISLYFRFSALFLFISIKSYPYTSLDVGVGSSCLFHNSSIGVDWTLPDTISAVDGLTIAID